MSTPVGIIKKFVKTLMETKNTGTEAIDEALKAVGAIRYDVFSSKYDSDQWYLSDKDFLEQVCGVRINNEDTGAITGSDAGGKTSKTAESIVPESTIAKELTAAEYKSFTKNGLTVNIEYDNKNDSDIGEEFGYSAKTYLDKQKLVTRALYNWWIPEALDLINESLGINFTDGRAALNKINIKFSDDTYTFYDNYYGDKYADGAIKLSFDYDLGRASSATIYINSNLLYNMTKNDKNGTLPQKSTINSEDIYFNGNNTYRRSVKFTNYLDRLILQSLTEISLKANIAYFTDLPLGIGLCALVGGYDDSSTYYDDFTGDRFASEDMIEDYTQLRYLAKNYSDGMPDGVSYNAKKTVLTVTTDFTDKKLDLADFESTVKTVKASALKSGIIIVGNKLDNSILGGSGNDSLVGGDGKDTLSGGKGNDSLTGGKGNDVFIYTAGNDVITDYATGDKISVGSAISKATLSGSDVIFTIGKNTLTVKKGKDKTLTLINAKGKEYTTVVSGGKDLTVTNSTKSPLIIDSDVKKVDASKRTKAITITGNKLGNVILGGSKNDIIYGEGGNDSILGNAGADKLYGGFGDDTLKGGAGNDILTGGAGNDSLWGDAGADTFIYSSGSGKDVIYGFDKNDTLTLDSMDFTATCKNKAVTLKFEEGSVVLQNYTATTFHINDDTYKISGGKFVKK